MVQTIEEIAELLKTLKLDTEVSNQETEKVLASINSKMESIADDYAANQLLKDYLVDLRREFDVRHDFNVSKYNEFEKAFNFINETINQRLDSNLQYAADRFDNLNTSIGKVNEDVSAKLDDISFDFHQKADENVDNITSALNVVSTKLDFVNNYLAEDVPTNFVALKEMNENLRDFVNEIGEAYKMEGQILEGKLSTRLFELEKSFVENVDRYYEKLSELKADTANFNNEFVEVLNGKTDGIVFAFEPLKNSIQAVLECDLSGNLTALKEQLDEVYSNVTTSMQLNLSQNQALVEGLEKLYNDAIEKINAIDATLNSQAQSNLELIKNAMEEIKQNAVVNLNGGTQIVEDFKPLLVSIEEKMERLSSTCAGVLANVAVDVTNALNTKLENIIEDLKNHIGLPVSANDLVFTVDNLKAELAVKFSELEGKQSTKEEDIATKEAIANILNQLNLKIEELGMCYSNDEFNEILGANKAHIMSGLKDLKNIILIAMKEVAKSSADSMDALHEKVDVLLQADTNVELHNKIDEIGAKTAAILEKIDTSDVVDEKVDAQNVLNSKLDTVYETNEKNAQALTCIYEKVDELVHSEDHVANTLMTVAEKFSGIRQNSEQLTNEIQGVVETVETINIRGEGVVSAVNDINSKTNDIVEAVNVVSDKVDILAASDEHISYTLDLISDKIDNNEATEQLTQGMQYLNEKMDTLNENEDRISRTMDDCLQDLQKKIDDIAKNALSEKDLNANANVIKEELMAAIANVFEQISFIEETEEIKGFVEEKTDEISQHIKDVQHQLRQIASNTGDENYSYSLQDVETDIAKLRMILNDISDAAPNEELNQLSDNVSKIENTVKDLQTTLTQEEFARFKADFDKINEDIVSISTRTNTLLLNSDNSYKSLSEGLAAFKGMVHNLNEKVNYLDNTEIQKRIERKISSINEAMISSANSNKVIREVLMYLGEWMDTTTENINTLSEKTNEITDIQSALSELKSCVPDKSNLFKVIEDKFEEQQERIDRLEMKLERVISTLEETDDTKLNKKVDKIERLINKLNENVEKLASYVDEE